MLLCAYETESSLGVKLIQGRIRNPSTILQASAVRLICIPLCSGLCFNDSLYIAKDCAFTIKICCE